MSALPFPDLPPGPHRDLLGELHDLHHLTGWPSLRTLARETGVSHTTVSHAFSSPRLPSWGTLELLVEAMHGTTAHFHDLWLAATTPPDEPPPAPRIAGRRAELAAVRRHLETGTGLLLVTGEAGMGKTRVIGTATATRADRRVCLLTAGCLPLSREAPLLPVADLLRAAYDVDDGGWLRAALDECAAYVPSVLCRLLPELSGPSHATDPEAAGVGQLFAAVAATIGALARHRPLAIVLEDLHWADGSTLDLLEHMLSRGLDVPVVATYRLDDPETVPATEHWRGRVVRRADVAALELRPLAVEETAEQLALLMGRAADPALVERIHHRAQGLPLFAEQLWAHSESDSSLPRLLAELLDRRLDRIGEGATHVAAALAVADRELTERQLLDVTGLAPPELTGSLRELDRARLLGAAATPDRARLGHPLLAEAIRRRMVVGEVAAAHRRLGTVLAADNDAPPAEVAAHWLAAGDRGQELGWRVRAAREAGARFDNRREAAEWARVLELWPSGDDEVHELRLCDVLVAALEVQELVDASALGGLSARAIALAQRLGGAGAAGLYQRVAVVCAWTGRGAGTDEALALLSRAIGLYRALPPCPDHVEALERQAWMLNVQGRYGEATASLETAVRMADALHDPPLIRDTLAELGWQAARSGDPARGLSMIDLAHRTEQPRPDPIGEVELAVLHTDVLLRVGGDAESIVGVAAPALELARGHGLETGRVGTLRANVAQALRHAGQVGRALEILAAAPVDPVGVGNAFENMERACLTALAGGAAEAAGLFAELDDLGIAHLQLRREHAEATATALLWSCDPGPVLVRLRSVLEDLVVTEVSSDLAATFALTARAAADEATRPGGRPVSRRQAAAEVADLLRHSAVSPFAAQPERPTVSAYAASWTAELGRLAGEDAVEPWTRAAVAWDRLARPHDAAYCRWRAAQVALRVGRGTVAARLLARAAADAGEHVPLHRAVTATLTGVC